MGLIKKHKLKYFFISSRLNNHVLDIAGASHEAGTEVLLYPLHGGDNQVFYQHKETKTIRSKLNDFCLDFVDGTLVVNPYDEDKESQQWSSYQNVIRSRSDPEMVLDVEGSHGPKILLFQHHGGDNQLWSFDFKKDGLDSSPSSSEDEG